MCIYILFKYTKRETEMVCLIIYIHIYTFTYKCLYIYIYIHCLFYSIILHIDRPLVADAQDTLDLGTCAPWVD